VTNAPTQPPTPLGLDADELVTCVECGLCLPHCPTYRVTGLEIASPRGRINAMRRIETGAAISDEFVDAMEACIQCRGCEAACPSSVPFGHLMEDTRAAIAPVAARRRSVVRRTVEAVGYRVLARHRLLLGATYALAAAQRLRMVPARFGAPRVRVADLRARPDFVEAASADAWLYTGCVMDAWQRPVHRAAARVLRAAGVRVAHPGRGGDCCGALHHHAGRRRDAQRLARRVMASMPGDRPVVVDSAGCGAAMKDYGRLLGTPDANAFAARVRDFSEFVAERDLPPTRRRAEVVVIQDPCHLRHVQRAHGAVRAVLAGAYELRETDDDGLCCGAGGIYSALQPELAGAARDRKISAIARAAGGDEVLVASANPGCALHLAACGLDVRHPAELLAEAVRCATDGCG
jgi:glycolate oxidase iron-sulfur subunit